MLEWKDKNKTVDKSDNAWDKPKDNSEKRKTYVVFWLVNTSSNNNKKNHDMCGK